jgi:exodeoxyribonuclease VII small subunit
MTSPNEREPSTRAEPGSGDGAPASYEAAVERLEEIIDRLDSGQAGLRETLDLCREGRELVDYCAGELDAVGEGLKELNLDDLAAKLDSSATPGP